MHILIVEDEIKTANFIKKGLSEHNFCIEVAYDGVEGLKKVSANPPDAVLLDVMMPEKDGYKMCKELKGNPDYANIAVILLTAVGDHVTTTRYSHYDGMSTEADDYIEKPASAETIIKSLKRVLRI